MPLSAADIKTLIDTAISLHSRALEAQKHHQWYRPLLLQAGAGLLGALIGAWVPSHIKPPDARVSTTSTIQTQPEPVSPPKK
jgi:uncharacterized membrane protein YfcA